MGKSIRIISSDTDGFAAVGRNTTRGHFQWKRVDSNASCANLWLIEDLVVLLESPTPNPCVDREYDRIQPPPRSFPL